MIASRACVLAVAAVLVAGRARAADVTVVAGVRVAPPTCPIAPLSIPAFVDSLRVELAGHARASGTMLVTLAVEPCDTATARVRVGVTSDTDPAGSERDVGLEDVALDARPRALALAVAELVRAATVAPAVAPPPPAVPTRSAPVAPSLATSLAADGVLALFPSRDTALWGGRLSLALDDARLGLALFAEAAAGEHRYDVGAVDLQSFGGGIIAGPRWRSGRLTLAPAVVGALAWVRIQGHAAAPDVAAGAGSGLAAALRARVALSSVVVRVVSVRAFVEGGWTVRGFDATVDGARAAGTSGATVVLGAGLAL